MIAGVRVPAARGLLLALVFALAMSGSAAAAGCNNEKCEAGRENGHHYGQERNDEDNGNHYGQTKAETEKPTPASSHSRPARSQGRGTSKHARVGTTEIDSHDKKATPRPASAERSTRRHRSEQPPPAGAAADTEPSWLAMKHFAADPEMALGNHMGRRRSSVAADWEDPSVPTVDPIGLASSAVQAARTLAFPLGLALAVSAFLLLQGRIDGRDPKMAVWRTEVAHFE